MFKKTIIASCVLAVCSAQASIVRDDVNYQYFRDFAENKGLFKVGATNVPVYDKSGNFVGTMLKNVSMPDLSVADIYGISALTGSQYVSGVKHNTGYRSVEFGERGANPDQHRFAYNLVNRNEFAERDTPENPNNLIPDYHTPRLAKLVTEVAPIETSNISDNNIYLDKKRFSSFARLGSGGQLLKQENGELVKASSGNSYVTGGVPVHFIRTDERLLGEDADIKGNEYGPLSTIGYYGDSGSPLFGYDEKLKKWVYVATLSTSNLITSNQFLIARPWFQAEKEKGDLGAVIASTNNNHRYDWYVKGNESEIVHDKLNYKVGLYDKSLENKDGNAQALDHGKNVLFKNRNATLVLHDNVNQGAGALLMQANVNVQGVHNDIQWQGAGVDVADGKTVTWSVKNPEGDRLSKIGKGTMVINGVGDNKGDLSLGDGTVILNQRADSAGRQHAFNQVGIVSGRGTLVLGAANQIDPNKLYFGFRGGRLDLNGQSLSFNYIQNTDEGAQIVNHNAKVASTVTITGEAPQKLKTADEITWHEWATRGDGLYEYHRGYWQDYFVLADPARSNPSKYFPLDQKNDGNWIFLGENKQKAIEYYLAEDAKKQAQPKYRAFSGMLGETNAKLHNGKLNVVYQPAPNTNSPLLMLSGGSQLNGDLVVRNGNLLLSGRPTPHAVEGHKKNEDVVIDNDWINRSFNASNMIADNATLWIGRNVQQVNANLQGLNKAKLNLGEIQGQTPECIRSDFTGDVSCQFNATLSNQALSSLPTTQIKGDVQLRNQSQLQLGKAELTGKITADKSSTVILNSESLWRLTGNSQIGSLNVVKGSEIYLNGSRTGFHQLVIDGDLTGDTRFHYNTDLARKLGDNVVVKGIARGNYVLAVQNSGVEPRTAQQLSLLHLQNKAQTQNGLNVSLEGGQVDLGAFRYQLVNENNDYRLVSHRISTTNKPKPAVRTQTTPTTVTKPTTTAGNSSAKANNNRIRIIYMRNGQPVDLSLEPLRYVNAEGSDSYIPLEAVAVEDVAENVDSENVADTAETVAETSPALAVADNVDNADSNVAQSSAEDSTANLATNRSVATASTLAAAPAFAQKDIISRYSNTGLSELSSATNAILQVGQNLDRHLRSNSDENVWLNQQNQNGWHSSDNYRPYDQNLSLTQIGVQHKFTDNVTTGAVLSQSRTSEDFDDGFSGKSRMMMGSAFVKAQSESGYFATLDTSYGRQKREIRGEQNAKFHRNISSVGLNLGKQWDVFGWLEITPSAGARYYHLSGVNYQLNGANIRANSLDLMAYNAGVKLGSSFELGGVKITPSLASYYQHARNQKMAVDGALSVNEQNLNQAFGKYANHELGLGLSVANWRMDINAGLLKGNEIRDQKYAGFKVGYVW